MKLVLSGTASTSFSYDSSNRLSVVDLPSGSFVSYQYDVDGRRVAQIVDGVQTSYVWDELSEYGDLLAEFGTTGAPAAQYTFGGNDILEETRSGNESYYINDGSTNVRALANGSGNVTDRYQYDAYGQLISREGTTTNPFRYRAQLYDDNTRLQYLRNRFLNPALGRFVTADPADYALEDRLDLNRYTYVGGDPINGYDPRGLGSLLESPLLYNPQIQNAMRWAYRNARSGEALLCVVYIQTRAIYLQYSVLLPFLRSGNWSDLFSFDLLAFWNRTVAVDHIALLGPNANTPVDALDEEDQLKQAKIYFLGIREDRVAVNRTSRKGRKQVPSGFKDILFSFETPIDVPGVPGLHAEEMLVGTIPPMFRGLAISAGRGICADVCLPLGVQSYDRHGFVEWFSLPPWRP